MTHLKVPITGESWRENRNRAIATFRENRHFLFSAYPDADALGAMLALSLYLNLLNKKATLFLPSPVKSHLQILKEIIQYNDIQVVTEGAALDSLKDEVDTVVFCDTAHARLVPCFSSFQQSFLSRGVAAIEIDHHFGNDSAAITENGIHLFREANASTEIVAELLRELHQASPDLPVPFEQRNIVISLLMGILTDTLGGRAVLLPDDYHYWDQVLGAGLGTRATVDDNLGKGNEQWFRQPQEILDHLNRLNPAQQQCVDELKGMIVRHQGVAELNLLDSSLTRLSTEPGKTGNGEFFQIWNAMANVVPQVGGKVGLFYFNGTSAEGSDCIFLKLRRAFDFHQFDLRESEPLLKNVFGDDYQGGGGHAMAVSFRIRPMREPEFQNKIAGLIDHLQSEI